MMKLKQARVNDGSSYDPLKGSQLPRHLINDVYEWVNEMPTVPIYYLAKSQPKERAWENQRGEKILLSLTLTRLCEVA